MARNKKRDCFCRTTFVWPRGVMNQSFPEKAGHHWEGTHILPMSGVLKTNIWPYSEYLFWISSVSSCPWGASRCHQDWAGCSLTCSLVLFWKTQREDIHGTLASEGLPVTSSGSYQNQYKSHGRRAKRWGEDLWCRGSKLILLDIGIQRLVPSWENTWWSIGDWGLRQINKGPQNAWET